MAKYLTIEWDQDEVRFLAAQVQRGRIRILAAEAIPLEHTAGETESSEEDVVLALQSALAERKLGRLPAIFVVPRRDVELLDLNLPPAEDTELPALVENLAANESPALREGAAMDFAVHDDDPQQPRRVTAAILTRPHRQRIDRIAEQLKLTPRRIVLRPYASASLFLRDHPARRTRCLLVNVIGEEADLVIVDGGLVKTTRTVRLPSVRTEASAVDQLVEEIRRTVLVAPMEDSEEPGVEAVYVLGGADEHAELATRVESELGLSAEHYDVFANVKDAEAVLQQDGSSFVPLLGAVAAEAAKTSPIVDFLNPKKPPKPPNRKLIAAVVAALVVTAIGGGVHYVQSQLAEVDEQNEQLVQRVNQLTQTLKKAQRKRALYLAVAAWRRSGVNWLDELRDLAMRLPPQREVVFRAITITPGRGRAAVVTLQGVARDQAAVTRMEQALRDRFHQVRTPKLEERVQGKTSMWQFESTVYVVRREKTQYRGLPAQSQPAAKGVAQSRATQPNRNAATKPSRSASGRYNQARRSGFAERPD
ncbi:MAG: hypothetical protein GXP27_05375 [Planctomycetes bacterium]|nr:hypothetical protein [Planctomycetota bacterium]